MRENRKTGFVSTWLHISIARGSVWVSQKFNGWYKITVCLDSLFDGYLLGHCRSSWFVFIKCFLVFVQFLFRLMILSDYVLSFHGFQTTNQLTQIYTRISSHTYIYIYTTSVVHIFLYQGCLPQLNIVYGLMAEQNHWRLGFSGWVWRDCRDHFSSFVLVKPVPPYVCSWNPEPQFFVADIDIPICPVFITISCAKFSMYFHIVQYIPIYIYNYINYDHYVCTYIYIYIYIYIKYICIYVYMSIIFPFPHIRWLYHHQLPIQPMPHPP